MIEEFINVTIALILFSAICTIVVWIIAPYLPYNVDYLRTYVSFVLASWLWFITSEEPSDYDLY